jgi:predicted RNase H-like HicB family nuclease
MVFTITIQRDEDGAWIAAAPSIPGCVSQGRTKEEALEHMKDAIKLSLEVRAEKGLPLTIETRQIHVPFARKPRNSAVRAKPRSRKPTAVLSPRLVRIGFEKGGKRIWTSPAYNSRNILPKIIKYARSQARKAGLNIDGAEEVAEVTTGKGWKVATA